MHKTTLEQWRMFKAVAEFGGFNQAAEQVHKSQSSIHHAVNKLEDSLGIQLLYVDGRKTRVTDAGKLMLRRAEYLLNEMERIESVAAHLEQGVETELRVAVDGAFPQCMLFTALERVSALYPQIRIDILDTVLSGANELITEQKADIALSPFTLPDGLNDEICQIEFVPVAHPDHQLHKKNRALRFEDLKSNRQIIVRDSARHTNVTRGWHGAEQRWTVGHLRASVDLVAHNLGFAFLPYPSVAHLIEEGRLKVLPLTEGNTRTATFYMNYLDKDLLGPAIRELMGELRVLSMDMQST